MTPDPDRKPTKEEMRAGGKVAALVLIFLAAALSGAFDRLDKITAALVTPVFFVAAAALIWRGRRK